MQVSTSEDSSGKNVEFCEIFVNSRNVIIKFNSLSAE